MLENGIKLKHKNIFFSQILDAAFNFGPQASRVTFGDLDLVTDAWKSDSAGVGGEGPADFSTLGNTVDAAQDALNNRARNFVRGLRRATAAAFNPLEDVAYDDLFQQNQYFISVPGDCNVPVDPHNIRSGMPI